MIWLNDTALIVSLDVGVRTSLDMDDGLERSNTDITPDEVAIMEENRDG